MRDQSQKINMLGVFIWAIAAFFYLYEFFLRTFVGSIAPELIHDLGLTVSEFTVIASAYYVAYGIMQLPVGLLVDRFGVKKILTFACALCVFSVLIFSKATAFMPAMVGRIIMGVGSAFAFVCLLLIVSNWFPKRLFGLFSGISILIGTMGPALAGGPLISWMNDMHISWRIALHMIAIIGVFSGALIICFVRCKPKKIKDVLVSKEPLMPQLKQLIRNKKIWVIGFYSGTTYAAISVMAAVWGTEYLDALGFSQKASAYMISTAWLAYAAACPAFGFLVDVTKCRKPFMIFSSLLGLGSVSLILYGHVHSEFAYIVFFAMLGFAAAGSSMSFSASIEVSGPKLRASALGLNNAIGMLTSAIMPILIGLFVSVSDGSSDAGHMPLQAMTFGLSVLPALYVVSLMLVVFGIKDRGKLSWGSTIIETLKTLVFHPKAGVKQMRSDP